jgi:hypothetical protein
MPKLVRLGQSGWIYLVRILSRRLFPSVLSPSVSVTLYAALFSVSCLLVIPLPNTNHPHNILLICSDSITVLPAPNYAFAIRNLIISLTACLPSHRHSPFNYECCGGGGRLGVTFINVRCTCLFINL